MGNTRVKFGLKIPNRLGKMSENLGVFLIHTVGLYKNIWYMPTYLLTRLRD